MTEEQLDAFDQRQRAQYEEYVATRNRYMTTEEVAQFIRVAPETLRYWRYIGGGPPSWKAGRRVLYTRIELERWIDARAKESS